MRFTKDNAKEFSKLGVEALRKKTAEEKAEMHRKGEATKAKNREQRKTMKYTLDTLLTKSLKRGELATVDDILSLAEMENKNVDVQTAIMVAVVQRALMGDMTAVQFLRDTVGEKPSDKFEVDSSLSVETWAKTHKVKL